MQPHETHAFFDRLRENLRTGALQLETKFRVCELKLSTESHALQEDLKGAIRRFEPVQGWLTFQSEVLKFKSAPDLERGLVLYGEMIDRKGRSLHIAEGGLSGWTTTVFQEEEEGVRASGGTPCLVEHFTLIGQGSHTGSLEGKPPDKLGYERYWRHDPDHGYLPWATRFIGFREAGGTS